MNEVKSLYNCTQQELYIVTRTGWGSYGKKVDDFGKLKKFYTLEMKTDAIKKIGDAEKLPDAAARKEAAEVANIQMTKLAKEGRTQWKKLKSYITSAFEKDIQKPKLESAGQGYYEGAGSNLWEDVKGLMTSGSQFIEKNETALKANENMPEEFKDEFNNAMDNFNSKYQFFLDAEEEAIKQTTAKIKANNAIYTDLMNMFKDGVLVFEEDETLSRDFVFSTVLELVTAPGPAGLKGEVTAADGTAIGGATLKLAELNKTVNASADGSYDFGNIASGTYILTVTANGYAPISRTVQVLKGTTSTLNIEMIPVE